MITCDRGNLSFEGRGSVLMAELATIMKGFLIEEICDKEMLIRTVESACMTGEELKEELVRNLLDVFGIEHVSRVDEMMQIVNDLKKEMGE